jgi:kanamycin kinase
MPVARAEIVDNAGVLDSLRSRYRGRAWTPVTLGLSGARVWRIEGAAPLYVKTAEHSQHRDSGFSIEAEAARLAWLATVGIPVPEVVETGADDQFAWLVTSAVAGRTAADPWPQACRAAVVDALADLALRLHALPIRSCPFNRNLAVTVPDAIHAVQAGLVNLDDMDAERVGWSATQLVTALKDGLPRTEDLVVCHGDFCLPNVLLDPETLEVTGVIDVGRTGIADRHADIALITRSLGNEINSQYKSGYARRFLDRYAAKAPANAVCDQKIDFYRLLDEFF